MPGDKYHTSTKYDIRKKALVEPAAAAAAVTSAAASAAPDPGSSRMAAPVHRSTAPVAGLLPEAAQLGCVPGPETAWVTLSSGCKKEAIG